MTGRMGLIIGFRAESGSSWLLVSSALRGLRMNGAILNRHKGSSRNHTFAGDYTLGDGQNV